MDKKQESFARNALRRAHFKWAPANKARLAARTEQKIAADTGRLAWHSRCAGCQGEFKERHLEQDHIVPVVNPKKGFQGLDIFAERLFVYEKGYQSLCATCHTKKSSLENVVRRKRRIR